jgi:hypothetical protein
MSRFEINPDTREPYIQEPRAVREPRNAKPPAPPADSWKKQPEQERQPRTDTPTTRQTF